MIFLRFLRALFGYLWVNFKNYFLFFYDFIDVFFSLLIQQQTAWLKPYYPVNIIIITTHIAISMPIMWCNNKFQMVLLQIIKPIVQHLITHQQHLQVRRLGALNQIGQLVMALLALCGKIFFSLVLLKKTRNIFYYKKFQVCYRSTRQSPSSVKKNAKRFSKFSIL